MASGKSDDSGGGRRGKVARLIAEYDLDGMGAELERRWTAEEDRSSLRELAAYFNRELLSEALAAAGAQPLEGEVENLYRLLTDDDVSAADRTRARRRLEREEVDVEGILSDFVTYQAVRTYLKSNRGAEYSREETDPIEREAANIQQLRGRVESVTEGKLERLATGGHVTLGEFRVLVDTQVLCEDCDTRLDVVELLEAGGCNCTDEA